MSYRSRKRQADRQSTTLTYLAPALAAHAILYAALTTFVGGNRLALWWLSLGLAAFALLGWDKFMAQRGWPRVPEVVFHTLTLAGGFAGTWLAMMSFRHKTRKPAFWAVVLLGAAVHLGLAFVWPGWLR